MFDSIPALGELFQARPLSEAAVHFLPAWALALWAGLRCRYQPPLVARTRHRRYVEALGTDSRWLFLAVLAWAGTASLRTMDLWNDLGYSHPGADPDWFHVIAWFNMGAGVISFGLIALALTFRGLSASRLGLTPLQHVTTIVLVLSFVCDSVLWLKVMEFYRPAYCGLPLWL